MRSLYVSGGCLQRNAASAYSDTLYYACSNSVLTPHKIYIFREADITFLHVCSDALLVGDANGSILVVSERKYKARLGIGENSVPLKPATAYCTVHEIERDVGSSDKYEITKFDLNAKVSCLGMSGNTIFAFASLQTSAVDAVDGFVFVGDTFGNLSVYKANAYIANTKAHDDSIKDVKSKVAEKHVLIVTASQDRMVKIWRFAEEMHCIAKVDILEGHSDWVMSASWNGNNVVSSSMDGSIMIWSKKESGEWTNTERLGDISGKKKAFYNAIPIQVTSSKELQRLFACSTTTKKEGVLGTEEDISVIIGQAHSGGFYFYANRQLLPFATGHLGEIRSIDWNQDFILTGGIDRTVRVFYKNREIGRAMDHGYMINDARWLQKEKLLKYDSLCAERRRNASLSSFMEEDFTEALTISVASQETILRVLEPTFLFLSNQGLGGGNTFTSINSELSLTNEDREDGVTGINEWSLSVNRFSEINKVYGHYFEISTVAVSEFRVFSANNSSDPKFAGIFVWDKKMAPLGYVKCHSLGINRLRVSVCNRYLLAASRDKTISLYKITHNGDELCLVRHISDHRRSVFDCGFNHNTTLFASVSRDKRLLIYDFNFSPVYEKKYSCEATCLSFSKRRNLLCVGLENGDVDIIDVECRSSQSFQAHGKRVTAVEFSERDILATGGLDGILRVFEL